ncbi:MAG: hypothetical protein HY866_02090, partial [Chloroflexi bacterium]|nr:hypothetical protein [Chloroflexota bacterium]
EFWDHGYNGDGLADPQGNPLGINWDFPGDNTDPDGWYTTFNQPVTAPASNAFSHMLEYDVIIFKSCFPNADIQSEEQAENYRRYFLSIRDVIDQHPDKLFIALTLPPLVPNSTTPEAAERAQQWAEYLTSPEFLDGHSNLVVFNFFNLLADETGFLRADFRPDEWDSHPNERANQTIGPLFVDFVDQSIRSFTPGIPPVEPVTQTTDTIVQANDLLSGFEIAALSEDRWWTYTNEPVNSFACVLDQPGRESDQTLRMDFDIPREGSAGCGVNFQSDPGWADYDGIRFYWKADQPDLVMVFALAATDPDPAAEEAAPFEKLLSTSGEEWTQVTVLWSDLVKADWFGDAGPSQFDPAWVVWAYFNVGYWEKDQAGTIWIDDIQLINAN